MRNRDLNSEKTWHCQDGWMKNNQTRIMNLEYFLLLLDTFLRQFVFHSLFFWPKPWQIEWWITFTLEWTWRMLHYETNNEFVYCPFIINPFIWEISNLYLWCLKLISKGNERKFFSMQVSFENVSMWWYKKVYDILEKVTFVVVVVAAEFDLSIFALVFQLKVHSYKLRNSWGFFQFLTSPPWPFLACYG